MSCEAHQISSAIYDARIILFPHLFFIAKISLEVYFLALLKRLHF